MDSQSEIMSHPSDGCSMSSNITRCTNVKIIIITIIIMTSSFTLPRSASQRSLLSPLRPHTIYVYNPTQSHTIQQALKNSYTIPQTLTQCYTIRHNTIQSHTIPYNPIQSHTIPYNPTQSHIIPDHHRVGGSSEKETPQLGLGDLLRKELIGEFY